MSSLSDFSDDSNEDQFSFLSFPPEIRAMIYEEYLPQNVTVGKEDDPELAIISTCRQVYGEAVPVLKKTACQLIIRCSRSLQLARSWIDQSGRPSILTPGPNSADRASLQLSVNIDFLSLSEQGFPVSLLNTLVLVAIPY